MHTPKIFKQIAMASILSGLIAAPSFAGSCADHIRVTKIGNIEVDVDGNVILNPQNLMYGDGFLATSQLTANGHIYARAIESAVFRNHVLSVLESAMATGEPVNLQVVVESTSWHRIVKASIGSGTYGLDCRSYGSEIKR